ncbi:MAG: alpha/beta hydrolase [Myxococcales bacterium]|nr:alpha/beta hydrolase [Myxococcales bacterium]
MKRILRLLALVVGLGLAIAIGSAWAPDRSPEELAARWAKPPSTFLPLAGMDVHLRDEGPRDAERTILLLHGTSSSLHTWDGWVEQLAEYRVVRVDLPGFGLTGPSPEGDYSISAYVRFVGALFDALSIERAVVAGNSFGGWIAWEAALAFPDRVEAIVLVDASGIPFEAQSMPIGFQLAKTPALGPLVQKLLPRSVVESSVRNVYGDPSRVTDELVDRHYELALREGNRAALVARFSQAAPKEEAIARVATIRVPTLILWGAEDRLIPPSVGERFADAIEGSTLVVFDGLGHVPHEEDPAQTLAPLAQLLKSLPSGP